MKLIVAIIRPDRLNEVLEALYRAEVRGLTLSRVLGHGGETERVETYRGTTVKMELVEKVRLEIGVSDPFVDVTVNAIRSAAASSTNAPCARVNRESTSSSEPIGRNTWACSDSSASAVCGSG